VAYYPTSAAGLNYISYPPGPVPGVSSVRLTANVSANTKGVYVQLAASSAFTSNRVFVHVQLAQETGRAYLLDIATGAGGSETVVVPNIITSSSGGSGFTGTGTYDIPLAIAASTRIAARIQSTTGSSVLDAALTLVAAGSYLGIASFAAVSVNTGTSRGINVDPGGVADTKGAYSELIASSAAIYQALALCVTNGANATPATGVWAVDLATGAAASEVVLIPDIRFVCNAITTGVFMPRSYTFATYIAASTRLASRASCNFTDATDRLVDVALLAGTAPAEGGGGVSKSPRSIASLSPVQVY